jgi:hypothetical protein
MEVLNDRLRICHTKKRVIANVIAITTKGLRRVHSIISLEEKCIGIPYRIISSNLDTASLCGIERRKSFVLV